MADLGGVKEAIRTYEKIAERLSFQLLDCVKEISSGGVRSHDSQA